MMETTALLVPVIPVSVRPRLTFVDMGGAAWVICRRIENGRYRWNARLHIDGERRSTRKQDLDDWRAERAPSHPSPFDRADDDQSRTIGPGHLSEQEVRE